MSKLKLTRDQLAKFLPHPEAIRVFEKLLADVGVHLPSDIDSTDVVANGALAEAHSTAKAVENLKQDTETNFAVTSAQINQLIDSLNSIAQSLALLATAPVKEDLDNNRKEIELGIQPPNVKQNADLGFFPLQWPTKNPRGNGNWVDLWVPQQHTFVDNVLSLRNQSRDADGTAYGLAAICMLDAAGHERGAIGYSRNSSIQPAGYTPDIVYVEFGDPFTGDNNPSSFQLICTMAPTSPWFPGTMFVPMEHITKTGATIIRARGGQPIFLSGGYTLTEDLSVGYKGNVKQVLGGMANTCWRIRERDNIDSVAITTNIDDFGVQDDSTKSSWKVKFGYGNTDDSFKIERAPAGSASFTELLKVAADGNVQLNTQSGNTLIGRANGGRLLVGAPTDDGATRLQVNGGIKHSSTTLLSTSVPLANGSGAAAGTLSNAPVAGNPTKWIPINDNGTIRYIPAW